MDTQRRVRRSLLHVPTLLVVAALLSGVLASTASAAHPGANGKIAYASRADGGDFDIFVIDPDGTGSTNLTADSPLDEILPAWSADGTRIAYTGYIGGAGEIWVMNADGTGKVQLTSHPADDLEPDFSPDGSLIAFGSSRDGGDYDVFVMNADGIGVVNLTADSPTDDGGPEYSPDGTRIAFTSSRDGNAEIYVMNADGSNPTRVTTEGYQDVMATWSPDGTKLLFRRDYGYGNGWAEVMQVNADGTGLVNLTGTPTIWENDPAFSPDGKQIVFASSQGEGWYSGHVSLDIWVMNADGSGQSKLAGAYGAYDLYPAWQPLAAPGGSFEGFAPPVAGPPAVNAVTAGQAIPVKFGLGGDHGLDVFAPGYPMSQAVSCDNLQPAGPAEPTRTPGGAGLTYDEETGLYGYVWKTDRAWAGTCRQLILEFDGFSTASALFSFK